jgi:hypothetical protein
MPASCHRVFMVRSPADEVSGQVGHIDGCPAAHVDGLRGRLDNRGSDV